MTYWKYLLYRVWRRVFPRRLEVKLGALPALRPVRDRFFRPGGVSEVVQGLVTWEDLQFHYAAPYQQLFKAQHGGIENGICRIARAVLRDGDTSLDVGANYGFITMVMARSIQPSGHVLSVDSDSGICNILKRAIEANNLSEVITVLARKVGCEDSGDCVRVDTIVGERKLGGVRFVKIDVDGGDFDVLRGAHETLVAYHPVVVIEMTRHQREIYECLVACGYTHFCDQSNTELRIGDWPLNLVASVAPIVVSAREDGSGVERKLL